MATIEEQLELERCMRERGADSYDRQQKEAEAQGRGAETNYARKLMREFMLPLIEALDDFTMQRKAAVRAKIRPLLAQCPSDVAMYLALQALFNHFTHETPIAHLATKIGRMIEDEVRFARFQGMYSEYYDEIKRDFKRKGTKDYRYMHRVLTHKANEKEDSWIEWSTDERAQIGIKLLDIILQNTDLVQKVQFTNHGKTTTLMVPTPSAKEWIDKHNELCRFMFPDKMPCIIPPDDWTALDQGGYYSPELRNSTPLIKTSGKRHKKHVRKADLTYVMDVANTLQAVPWEVNLEVLDVVRAVWAKNLGIGMPPSNPLPIPPCPVADVRKEDFTEEQKEIWTDWKRYAAEIHTREKERIGKSYQVSRILRLAKEYSQYPEFYYVWTYDSRGRIYTATSGFSPQGPDLAKGILRLRRGKPIGHEAGWLWFKINMANRYGYDKASYLDRAKWVDERHDEFIRAANNPLSYAEVWAAADKPYQFLATLFEYRDAFALEALGRSKYEFVSHVAVGQDGSCNGLQNFSAMLRDRRGGAATNLLPSDVPADIYSEVAKVATEKVREILRSGNASPEDAAYATRWVQFFDEHGKGSVPRSMAKRPVMTLPYGATRQSCTSYIFESIMEIAPEYFNGAFRAASWLTPYLWSSIGEVVIAARDAMAWLQKCSGVISKDNVPITWTAIDGFPIYQGTMQIETKQVRTQLAGDFQMRVGTITDNIDKNKQRLGIAPNFVHSNDAAHLRETVRRAKAAGITDLALIHDDYGTYACDTPKLNRIIREAFVSMYEHSDPLQQFLNENAKDGREFPAMPPRGDLEIRDVLKSPYFFG